MECTTVHCALYRLYGRRRPKQISGLATFSSTPERGFVANKVKHVFQNLVAIFCQFQFRSRPKKVVDKMLLIFR